MFQEIQGVMYDEAQLAILRQEEEAAAEEFLQDYKQQMYAEWLKEPTPVDFARILAMFPKTLKDNDQKAEEIIAAMPFSAARYLEVVNRIVVFAGLEEWQICPVCGTPLIHSTAIFGKDDNGMRCALNRIHSVVWMAAEVMPREQLIQVFGGTWLAHMIDMSLTNVFAATK